MHFTVRMTSLAIQNLHLETSLKSHPIEAGACWRRGTGSQTEKFKVWKIMSQLYVTAQVF